MSNFQMARNLILTFAAYKQLKHLIFLRFLHDIFYETPSVLLTMQMAQPHRMHPSNGGEFHIYGKYFE